MTQKISSFQCILLMMSTIISSAILSVPNIVVRFSKQDSWISIVIATIVGILFATLIGSICRQNSKRTFLDWLKFRFGSKAGTGVGILLTGYYFSVVLLIMREFVNFLAEDVLTETPIFILLLITVIVVIYAVHQGIEVIARINLIVVMLSCPIFLVTVILVAKDIHPNLLLPVWDHSLSDLMHGGMVPISFLSEVSILLLVAPFLNHPEKARKAGIWGVIIAGIELSIIVAATIAIFGPQLVSHMTYPTFNVISIIKIGRFLERVDILFISIWICLMYIKMSIFMFGAFHCFVQTYQIRSEKPFLFILGLLAVLSSLYTWPRSTDLIDFYVYPLVPYLLTLNVLLPLIIWLCLRMNRPKTSGEGN